MSTYTSHRATKRPRRYKGEHRHHSGRRSILAVSMGTLLAAAFTVGCSGVATPDTGKPAPITTPQTIPAPPNKAVGVGSGTYEVGTDIKAGTYTTTVPGEADDITASCYWARLKDFDGDLGSILANGNLDGGSKGRVVVKAKDAGIEFRGDCRWVRK